MYGKAFWRAAWERALFTFAQAFLSTPAGIALVDAIADIGRGHISLTLMQHLGLLLLTSLVVASIAAGASILSSVVKARKDGNPSLGNQEVLSTTNRLGV
jgi:hypothetical protein